MEGIEFEKETYTRPIYIQQQVPKKSWAIRLVTKLSGGKIDEQKAPYILLVVVILLIISSIYNFASISNKHTPSQAEILKQKNTMEEQLRIHAANYQ